MKNIFLALMVFISCSQNNKHYGVRRDNKVELKKAAEAVLNRASGNFEIVMYGDTAEILGDTIIYKYRKPLPENMTYKKIKVKSGVWYWALPIGYTIGVNNYEWKVIKDTAFPLYNGFKYDTVNMFKLEKLGVVKRKYICD